MFSSYSPSTLNDRKVREDVDALLSADGKTLSVENLGRQLQIILEEEKRW